MVLRGVYSGVELVKKRWVIITGKGEAYITSAASAGMAVTVFNKKFAGLEVASVFEAIEF